MARFSHTNESPKSSNPTTKYLEWRSNDKCFRYYDKEMGENVEVQLPWKFAFLNHYHTVKGWHDKNQSGIYSNEVYFIGNEPMTVRSFKPKGFVVADGLYKDIKTQVAAQGGKYHRSVYVMLEDGTIANLAFKGAVVREWSEFYKLAKPVEDTNWIEINEATDQKKGSINYSTPLFSIGKKFTAVQDAKVDEAANRLRVHMDAYFSKVEEPEFEADEIDF